MKLFSLISIWIGLFVSTTAVAKTDLEQNLKKVLETPLIVGASVSGDYFVESPGKILALKYTSPRQIQVLTQRGKTSTEILKHFSEKSVKGRSIIIGIDLFFWDSFHSLPQLALQQLEKIVNLAEKNKIPLVLGEVPLLSPLMQKSSSVINKKMHELCRRTTQCFILPINKKKKKTMADGFLNHEGQRYDLRSLIPDGLHIARPASQFLANQIKKLLLT